MRIVYMKDSLTGGGAGALDGIDGATLNDSDFAFVFDSASDVVYMYRLVAASGAAESSPDVIAPDLNAGTKRWILQQVYGATGGGGGTEVTAFGTVYTARVVASVAELQTAVNTDGVQQLVLDWDGEQTLTDDLRLRPENGPFVLHGAYGKRPKLNLGTYGILFEISGGTTTGPWSADVTSGSDVITVTTANVDFTTMGIKVGDFCRTNQDAPSGDGSTRTNWHVITEIISATQIRVNHTFDASVTGTGFSVTSTGFEASVTWNATRDITVSNNVDFTNGTGYNRVGPGWLVEGRDFGSFFQVLSASGGTLEVDEAPLGDNSGVRSIEFGWVIDIRNVTFVVNQDYQFMMGYKCGVRKLYWRDVTFEFSTSVWDMAWDYDGVPGGAVLENVYAVPQTSGLTLPMTWPLPCGTLIRNSRMPAVNGWPVMFEGSEIFGTAADGGWNTHAVWPISSADGKEFRCGVRNCRFTGDRDTEDGYISGRETAGSANYAPIVVESSVDSGGKSVGHSLVASAGSEGVGGGGDGTYTIFCKTSTGAISLYLTRREWDGSVVKVVDVDGQGATNNVTLNADTGSTFSDTGTGSTTLATDGFVVEYVYDAAASVWRKVI